MDFIFHARILPFLPHLGPICKLSNPRLIPYPPSFSTYMILVIGHMNADIFGFNWTVTASPQTQIYCCNNLFIIQGPSHQWFFSSLLKYLIFVRTDSFGILDLYPISFGRKNLQVVPQLNKRLRHHISSLFLRRMRFNSEIVLDFVWVPSPCTTLCFSGSDKLLGS